MKPVLLIELNEICFDLVHGYVRRGFLPHLGGLIARHGVSETTSEERFEDLEPWIQWVTAHTGLSFAEHGVFRLGDIVHHDLAQIWEMLEDAGLSVAAVSPMNAKNRTKNASFFLPDPWTMTRVTGSTVVRNLHDAIVQVVNDNAQARVSAKSRFWLAAGLLLNAQIENYGHYVRLARESRQKPWSRAVFLDTFLSDIFVRQTRLFKPDFASLFLNGGAHIQHHYMFSSAAYRGSQRNPDWYVPLGEDPILEVYSAYDRILSQIGKTFSGHRVMIATGLHQEPHRSITYYWRLKDHEAFLKKLDIPFLRVEPRMSRDFLVVCDSECQAREAERALASLTCGDGTRVFEVDNRGRDLFVTLSYPHEITPLSRFSAGNRTYDNVSSDVAFVAIKNGQHNGLGYFIDTGVNATDRPKSFELKRLPAMIRGALAC